MSMKIETTSGFDKDFIKLDRYTQKMLKTHIEHFARLSSHHERQSRLHIGDYRLLYDIHDDTVVLLALTTGC